MIKRVQSSVATLALLLFIHLNFSQESMAQVSVALGPKAGASFSGFRGEDAAEVNLRKGLAGGLFLAISPLQFLTIQPEILFQQKGAVNENEDLNFKEDIKIGYLNVPLLFKLRLPIFRTIFPHIYAGPQVSYAFQNDYSISTMDGGAMFKEIDFRKVDFAGVFGAGLDVEVRHLFFTVDFRYGLGALTVSSDDEITLKNKDMAALLGVGYKF